MSAEAPPDPLGLVDRYLTAFRDGVAPAVAGQAMAEGYLLDDGAVQLIAADAVPARIGALRDGSAAAGERLDSWHLTSGGGSTAVTVVRAELRWRSAAAVRTHHIDYVVRTSGPTARVIAIVTP